MSTPMIALWAFFAPSLLVLGLVLAARVYDHFRRAAEALPDRGSALDLALLNARRPMSQAEVDKILDRIARDARETT